MKLTRKERAALIPNDLDIILMDQDTLWKTIKNLPKQIRKDGNVIARVKKLRKDIVIRHFTVGGAAGWWCFTKERYLKLKAEGLLPEGVQP